MLTKLTVVNFKRFEKVEIELANPVVFIGPNDSGKTTALQALTLWDIGLRRWNEKRRGKSAPQKRPGVTINRRDLLYVPVPDARLLWRNRNVRETQVIAEMQETRNIRIDIIVEGVSQGKHWKCGLEFDYANEESFYCRPLRLSEGKDSEPMPIPEEAGGIPIVLLPPMSGLAAREDRLDPGSISVRLGEGRTAEVMRNLCYQIVNGPEGSQQWERLCKQMKDLFGVALDEPKYIAERGEVTMTYNDRQGNQLDLSCSGRGMQQTLLLLSYLTVNKGAVLLLDEPDAHLEILRQRQIYQLLTDTAREQDNQIICASHSEVILNEAAGRDVVVAFLGKPHRIDNRGSQLLKSLKDIGFEDYCQAEETGWVLYLEGSTDLAILLAFAEVLQHPAKKCLCLERLFVRYVQNLPSKAHDHFYGLREAKNNLVGFALFDRLEQKLEHKPRLTQHRWSRREIENYLCQKITLLGWAEAEGRVQVGELFASSWRSRMEETIVEIEKALQTLGKSPWSNDIKASDEFLEHLFELFYKKLNFPNLMKKSGYHVLARYVPRDAIDNEVRQVLDQIVEVAEKAQHALSEENS
jgi:predicted ATPase